MRDELDLGPSPALEDCVQMGEPDYLARATEECQRYIEVIRRAMGQEPPGARLKVKRNPHEFGTYLSVVVRFDDGDRAGLEYAYRCEGKGPITWNGEARRAG